MFSGYSAEAACRRTRQMNRYRKLQVLARFHPRVTGDLVPELSRVINTETVFTYTRQMDEDEPFPGEWVLKTEDERFGDYWIPERDLEIIRECPKGNC
jgi:hypothetical protein